jgi:hypothetical protein
LSLVILNTDFAEADEHHRSPILETIAHSRIMTSYIDTRVLCMLLLESHVAKSVRVAICHRGGSVAALTEVKAAAYHSVTIVVDQ